jgi:predicted RNA binding protein YcfA (HicA-like mRNA interferase family)
MKKASDVFKSIRYAKVIPRDKPHKSTDDEEHVTVGEKEYEDQVKHVKKMAGMAEEKKDKYDEGEYDREGDMAKSDLRSIIANAQKLHDMIDDADNLPEWVQSKITIAEDYISTVANYMTAEVKEEVEKPTGELKDACWKGYTAVGMKMKNGRKVPNCVPVKEEQEQLDEMPGANMDTRAVHSHLKKKGWKLTRTSGSHDVYTHDEASHHIAVPRHKQLKAPLVKGILKQSEVREEFVAEDKDYDERMKKALDRAKTATPRKPADEYERKVVKYLKKRHEVNESRAKDIAKMAARRNAGIKEQSEPEDSPEKTDTPAKRSLSKTAGMVKDLAKNAKPSKKEKPDTFQPEPELSSQIVKV